MHTKQLQLIGINRTGDKINLLVDMGTELSSYSFAISSLNGHPFFVPDHKFAEDFTFMAWAIKPLVRAVQEFYDGVEVSLPIALDYR